MKKIQQIVTGATQALADKFKVQRIEKTVEIAKLNAEQTLAEAEANLESFPTESKDMSPERIISRLSELISAKDDAEATLKQLAKIEAYLNQEVTE